MNYYDTLILVSEDCPVHEGRNPVSNRKKKTVAEIEYELLHQNPGHYTQDELQFEVHMKHKEIPTADRGEEKARFLAKSRACMRASALPKRFGWGIYFDEDGKAEAVAVDSDRYQDLQKRENVKKYKAMRSKK